MMDKQLRFERLLPLEEMALRRIAVHLWNGNDILTSIGEFYCDVNNTCALELDWERDVETKAKDKVSKLGLPDFFKRRLTQAIRPIGQEILKWTRSFHEPSILIYYLRYSSARVLKQLHWTSAGTLDYRKTAEGLIRLNIFGVSENYKLACEYCLVDSLPLLWGKLSPWEQEMFFQVENYQRDKVTFLELYWTYFIKREESKQYSIFSEFLDFNESAFTNSVHTGNKVATKYFFPKLSDEKRNACLFKAIAYIVDVRRRTDDITQEMPEVLLYLISQMSSEEQMQVFKERTRGILRFFMDWSLQDLFLDIADNAWEFRSENSFYNLLYDIIEEAASSGNYFPDLMQKCFLRSPADFRTRFIRRFVFYFRKFEDVETARIVFRNVDSEIKAELLFGTGWFFGLLSDLVLNDDWHLVEECVQEAALSEEDKKRLMDRLWRSLLFSEKLPKGQIFKILSDLLDENDASARGWAEDEPVTAIKNSSPKIKRTIHPEVKKTLQILLSWYKQLY